MPTNDERREVANQLRDARPSTYYDEELADLIKDALLPAYPVETWREPTDVLSALADLIDPTCEAAYNNPFASDFNYRCMACGEHFSTCGEPKYCPGCGGRIEYVK